MKNPANFYIKIILFIYVILPFISSSQISLVTDFNNKPNGTQFRQFVQADRLTYFLTYNTGSNNLWRTDGTFEGTILLKDSLESDALENGYYTVLNGELYFFKHQNHKELWKTEGTVKGTVKLVTSNSSSDDIINVNGTIYFSGNDNLHGEELWTTDGTVTGTHILRDLRPGTQSSYPHAFIACNGLLVFNCQNTLWRSDGTPDGTYLLNNIERYFPGYYPTPGDEISYKNTVYFGGKNSRGDELWKTDGTVAGTVLVKDINPGSSSSYPSQFIGAGNYVYFIALDKVNGSNLWRTDGTENGTILILPLNLSSYSMSYTVLNDVFYVLIYSNDHTKLWKTDGTITGSSLVKDFYDSQNKYFSKFLKAVNGVLYFNGYDSLHGDELWKSDGTPEGTIMVSDIFPGTKSSSPDFLNYFNGKLFLSITDSSNYHQIWSYDIANRSLALLKDFVNSGDYMDIANTSYSHYIFEADDGISGNELWLTDGTSKGTILLKDISPGTQSANINGIDIWNNELYFIARNNNYNYGLYKTNGTQSDIKLVKNLGTWNPGNFSSLNHSGNLMFFTINDKTYGKELWVSDGTEYGTKMLKDIYVGSESSNINEGLYLNGILYFFASDSIHGQALWKSNGTSQGTIIVKDICPGCSINYGSFDLCNFGNRIAFTGFDTIYGGELWISDGTDSGTYMVKDIYTGHSGHVHHKIYYKNQLFFGADDIPHGFQLWKTDGTENGTIMLTDTISKSLGSEFNSFGIFNGTLYFIRSDSFNRLCLYKSDGTKTGTKFVKVLYKIGNSIKIVSLDSIMVFFCYSYDKNCTEIWRSDGTVAGTYVIKSFYYGMQYSLLYDNTVLNNKIYFQADDSVHGGELWCSDGTNAGTYMVGEINPGIEPSIKGNFKTNGKEVFFIANSSYYGTEIFKYFPSPAPENQDYGIEFYNVQKRQMSIRWTRGNGEKCIAFMKKGNSGIPELSNDKTYRASYIYSTGNWSDDREWYCIYNGTGNNVTAIALQPATEYRVMVIEYNGKPGKEYYNCSLTGYNAGNQYTQIDASDNEARDIKIYPNPANGWLMISDIEDCRVVMYNYCGKLVNDFYSSTDLQLLDISRLAAGIYILKIIGNNISLTKKVIVTK